MSKKVVTSVAADGHSTLHIEHGHMVAHRTQDTDPYYEFNRKMQNAIDKSAVTRKGGWAIPIGNIPFADYQNLIKANPDLNSTDAQIKTAAWLKTLRDIGNAKLRTVDRKLIPDSMTPDAGSVILPGRLTLGEEK